MGAVYWAELTAVVCFVLVFRQLRVAAAARRAVDVGLGAARLMRDPAVSDARKEQEARAASLALLRAFGSITMRSGAALAASALPLAVFHLTGAASIAAVNQLMSSWNGLLLAVLAVAVLYAAKVGA